MRSIILNALSYLRKLNYILTRRQKRASIVVFFFILISSVLEMIGISIFIPYISAIINPNEIRKNAIIDEILNLFGITKDVEIIVFMSIVVIVVYIIKDLMLIASDYFGLKYDYSIQKELSVMMLGSYLRRPYEDILDINTAEVLRGINNDSTGICYIIKAFFGIMLEGKR